MDPGEPLPFECLPGPGAAKGRNKRRSSILKQARPVLQVGETCLVLMPCLRFDLGVLRGSGYMGYETLPITCFTDIF